MRRGAGRGGDGMEIAGPETLQSVTTDPVAIRLYLYWLQCRGAKQFPSRDDIDPIEFRFALGRVSLIDVLDQPRRYRYRLVGTMVTEHLGYEMTGRFLDQLPESQVRAYLEQVYGNVVAQRVPVHESGQTVLDGRLWKYESLVLPLSSDGQAINLLMAYRASDRPKRAERGGAAARQSG
jgi:hypothetical protein